jgi:hypothetical protein
MPKRTRAEDDAVLDDIRTRFAAGETLTMLSTRYKGKFTLGELKQIVQDQSKRPSGPQPDPNAREPNTGSGIGPR